MESTCVSYAACNVLPGTIYILHQPPRFLLYSIALSYLQYLIFLQWSLFLEDTVLIPHKTCRQYAIYLEVSDIE